MAHYSRLDKIVIDVAPDDHDAELAFWAGAIGPPLIQSERYAEYHSGEIPGQDIGILVQRLPTTWNTTAPRASSSSASGSDGPTECPSGGTVVRRTNNMIRDFDASFTRFGNAMTLVVAGRGSRHEHEEVRGASPRRRRPRRSFGDEWSSFGIALPPLMVQALRDELPGFRGLRSVDGASAPVSWAPSRRPVPRCRTFARVG